MKYIIELEKIEGTDLYRAVGANTLVFDERGIKNILTPLSEAEPDWSTVAVDTPILVSDGGIVWYRGHFAKYKDGHVYAWNSGGTSFTAYNSDNITYWEYAKLPEVEE